MSAASYERVSIRGTGQAPQSLMDTVERGRAASWLMLPNTEKHYPGYRDNCNQAKSRTLHDADSSKIQRHGHLGLAGGQAGPVYLQAPDGGVVARTVPNGST